MEELYEKIKDAGISKKYKMYSRSDLIIRRPDLIEKWKSIGLEAILIGFESFRNEELKKWNKKSTVEKNIEASRIIKDHGLEIVGYFMIDQSYTEEDFLRLIDHVKKIDIDQPVFSIVTPFPGTQIYEELKDKIITKNYEYFDGMHALTPTVIHPIRFYKLYTDLFSKIYPKRKIIKKILKGKIGFSLPQAYAQMRYLKQLGPVEM